MVIPSIETQNLEREVLRITSVTSDKFVYAPKKEQVISDLIIGLKRFRNSVRWKWFFQEEKRKKNELKNSLLNKSAYDRDKIFNDNDEENESPTSIRQEGLKSGLAPVKTTQDAPIGSPEVEGFLKEVEIKLIDQINKEDFSNVKNNRDRTIDTLLERLRRSNQVVIATDKTNSFKVIPLDKYKKMVLGHLRASAKEIPRDRIIELFDTAKNEQAKFEDLLSANEEKFLTKSIDSRSIPTPKLIIKDHKKQDQNGDYPSRLIVPASNFISGFPRLGYLGIRRILDENKINYEKRTIVQASTLKMEIEKMKLKKREVTIAKLDIVAMYPSIQFLIVKKAVRYFARELSSENNQKIEKCLEMIGFGMKNTLVSFIDKYYEYGGEMEDEKRGLTIGGYESAWLADLVAAYLLEMTKEKFDNFVYHGIYRDNGFY